MVAKSIRTMEEFARSVGLSRPTVSKYFQDPGSVRPKVREKIEAAVGQTGFRPNLFAVNLNRRRSKIIGLIFPSSLDPFYMGLRRQIEREASMAGYLPFAFSTDGKADLEAEAIETLTSLNVAGVIMAPVGAWGEGRQRDKVKALARNIPIVFIDAPFDAEEAFVGTNNAQSVGLITDYLTRFGEVPCYFDMPQGNSNKSERLAAYQATLRARGMEPLIVATEPADTWDFERNAFDQTRRVLRQGGFPSRIVLCANDRTAFGVVAALLQGGVKVGIGPECDLRVAGHDDQPFSEFIWPPLTTVSQNMGEMGRLAIGLLLARLEEGPADSERRATGGHVLVDARLVLRQSA